MHRRDYQDESRDRRGMTAQSSWRHHHRDDGVAVAGELGGDDIPDHRRSSGGPIHSSLSDDDYHHRDRDLDSTMYSSRRRKARSLLLLSGLSFLALIVVDGVMRLSSSGSGGEDVLLPHPDGEYVGRLGAVVAVDGVGGGGGSGGGDSLFRRLVSSALSTSTAPYDDGQRGRQRREEQQQRPPPPRRKSKKMALHAVPLMPSHAVAHRRRMELIERELPIPVGLREGREYDYDDNGVTKTRTTRRRRRRAYDAMPAENSHRSLEGGGGEADDTYEIGALYQGYGTHYIDLYVGSPIPQRQTVIVDTGSSVTSFPCTGCRDCGSISDNRAVGGAIDDVGPFHTDDVFRKGESDTYMEKACRIGGNAMRCDFGQCVSNNRNNNRMGRCEVTVSYAEGSSWTALEGEDLVRPDVPQDDVAGIEQRRMSDVGEGADVTGEDGDDGVGGTSTTYDWSDFRLKFGCQKKVRSLA